VEDIMLRPILIVSLAALPLAAHADDCRFGAERSLDVDAGGVRTFKLDTGAGDLDVVGVPGLARIEIRGKACASEEAALAGIQFVEQHEGAVASVATKIPNEGFQWALFGGQYAYLDVHVRMPAGMKLDLRDSSGDLEVSGLTGGVDVVDSSGDITLRDLGGPVNVTDTSGDIDVRGIAGDFTVISDTSGDIQIADVRGDALVREDSSGDVEFHRVAGNARVDRDSSGDIEFDDIGRDAGVGSDSSGEIRARHVRGNFNVQSKSGGSKNIAYSDIGGKVSIPPAD
jgi:hypothetical protein